MGESVIRINEIVFVLAFVMLALTCIVYGLRLTYQRTVIRSSREARRVIAAESSAEQQAEQIIQACWPDERMFT